MPPSKRVHRVDAERAAHARAGRHRRREAHAVQPVVDPHPALTGAARPRTTSPGSSDERQVAVRRSSSPNGPAAARSRSTWIHWWSPVASANASMRSCVTSSQEDGPSSSPIGVSVARSCRQPYRRSGDARRGSSRLRGDRVRPAGRTRSVMWLPGAVDEPCRRRAAPRVRSRVRPRAMMRRRPRRAERSRARAGAASGTRRVAASAGQSTPNVPRSPPRCAPDGTAAGPSRPAAPRLGVVERRDVVVPAAVVEVRHRRARTRGTRRTTDTPARGGRARADLVEHRRIDLGGHVEDERPLDPLRTRSRRRSSVSRPPKEWPPITTRSSPSASRAPSRSAA